MRPKKFAECGGCRFYNQKFQPPECGECGAGEFFEARIRTSAPTEAELMAIYRKTYDE